MIGVELVHAVLEEPSGQVNPYGRVQMQTSGLATGAGGILRLVYVPGLALVVIVYHDRSAAIVPVERVRHMTPKHDEAVLEKLAEVLR